MLIPPDSASVGSAARHLDSALQSRKVKGRQGPDRGLDPAVEQALLRERRRQYGRAVRDQLAERHRRAELAREAALDAKLMAQNEQRPSPRCRDKLPAAQPRTADALQAILSVARRLEDKLDKLPSCPPSQPAILAAARHAQQATPSSDPPHNAGSSKLPAKQCMAPQAAQDRHSPRTCSPLSSITTPGGSVLAGGSLDSLLSAWGLHASKKLRKILRQRQPPGGAASKSTQGQQAGQEDAHPSPGANLQRYFRSFSPDMELQQPKQEAGPRPGSTDDLVDKLLRFEAEGDPFSIINLYLKEQQQKLQAKLRKQGEVPRPAVACAKQPPENLHEKQSQPGAPAKPMLLLTDEDRPVSAASNQENVSANVGSARPGARPTLVPGVFGQRSQHASGAVGDTPLGAPPLENALQAELARLIELQEAELDLAQLEHSQIVGAAQREIDSLEAALEEQVAQRVRLECGTSPVSPGQAALQLQQAVPDPQQQSQATHPSTVAAHAATEGRPVGVEAADPAQQQLQQLMSIMQLSQQQQLVYLQHLSHMQQHQQHQLSVLQLQRQHVAALPMTDVSAVPLAPQHEWPLPAGRAHAALAEQVAEVPAVESPAPSGREAAGQELPLLALPQPLSGSPGDILPATTSKQRYVQQWLDGAESEDQYSMDPDHLDVEEEAAIPAVQVAQVQLQQHSLVDGAAPADAGDCAWHPRRSRQTEAAGVAPSSSSSSSARVEGQALPCVEVQQAPAMPPAADEEPGAAHAEATRLKGAMLPSTCSPQRVSAEAPAGSAGMQALVPAALPSALQPAPAAVNAESSPASPTMPVAAPAIQQPPPAAAANASYRSHVAAAASAAPPLISREDAASEYSMNFEDFGDAEFSYTDQYTTTTLAGTTAPPAGPLRDGSLPADQQPAQLLPPSAAGQQQPAVERPGSPRQLTRLVTPPSNAVRPTSPYSPRHRPMSPYALDDKHPTPPRSPGHADSRPASPSPNMLVAATAAVAAADSLAACSRPGSPSLPDAEAAASGQRTPPFSPRASSPDGQQPQQSLTCPQSPLHSKLVDPHLASPALSQADGACASQLQGPAAADDSPSPVHSDAEPDVLGAPAVQNVQHPEEWPMSTRTAVPAAAATPGSPRLEDDTVVQSQDHAQQYVQQVLGYFWQHRAQSYARGEQPLDLKGFLHLERHREPVGDPQHIFNKLLYDAVNEALAQHYNKTLTSFAGKVAPERALLDQERVSHFVTNKVLSWAGMGCTEADVSRMLAEDAIEDERTLSLLADVMLREIAEGRSGAASPLDYSQPASMPFQVTESH